MRSIAAALLCLCILTLAACGGQEPTPGENTDPAGQQETQEESNPNEVDTIQYETEQGTIAYTGYEYADWALVKNNSTLTQEDTVLVLKFDFTNQQTNPAQVQSAFTIQAFQNGVEITENLSYSSGGAQYDLIGNYFADVLKGGTVSFGRLYPLKDNSPVTIMVSERGGDENAYQMMTLDLAQAQAEAQAQADQVEQLLQGTWTLDSSSGNSGTFTFSQGTITVLTGGSSITGTYTIDAAGQQVSGTLQATNGSVNILLPFQLEGDTLTLFNNSGEALVKQ